MQLHVHYQIAHVARAGKDGKWRAPDSLGYAEHVGAVAAITAQHLEEALTARFGVEWSAREDGNGFEIKGIAQELMDLFSSRRRAITADVRVRDARFEERYGRAPSQRELAQLAQSSNFATRKGKEGTLDLAQAHAGRADKLARTLSVPLASVAPSVWHADAHHAASSAQDAGTALTCAAQRALTLAQQEKSVWTRADLVKHLGRPYSALAGLRKLRPGCWRRPQTGSCAQSSSRCCAWRPPTRSTCRTTWSARTAAACTGATAAPATPPARSCQWRSS
jgi:hypothetical protein